MSADVSEVEVILPSEEFPDPTKEASLSKFNVEIESMIIENQLDQDEIEAKLLDNGTQNLGTDSEIVLLDEDVLLEENKGDTTSEPQEVTPLVENLNHVEDTPMEERNESKEAVWNGYEQDYFQSLSAHEIGRCSWDRAAKQNYIRGCLWSPDGSCVLTTANNDGMHVFELPADMYEAQEVSPQRPVNLMESAVHVRETTLVYDYKWYPGMHSSMPETSVWIASRQHEPIQMWDAYTGKLRCSYKGYNAVDEVEAALSLTWSIDGGFIYGGYKKSIKTFDVKAPGREIASFPTKVTASCMTVCTPLPNLLIFGSWNRTITALSTNSHQTIPVGNNSREYSHNAGVTWLKFIPRTNLFASGGRKDNKLMLWDIRNLQKPFHVLERSCDTNQRMYFDASPFGEWLATGNTDGVVRVWNLREIDTIGKSYRKYDFPLHRDCCNGVSFHPTRPIVATTSGQFHPNADSVDYTDQLDDQQLADDKAHRETPENSLTLWWIGKALSEE
ncbi:telomerase Cajal body protein 1 homolog [Armigeres subalbatus]|uniref:telomerase Cajal body protein 1 homolog n=1 Tax=Armigeres subalbatus TaxID=124917 RepID=UPI002ED4B95E